MPSRPIRFFHRGQMVEVHDAPPTRTVLQWLREDARCTGTKEGCAEGDCGACTVIVGEPARGGGLSLHAVNACIRFLPTLHGKALFTVEDVTAAGGVPAPGQPLHPVQQALVDCHGSQCGFCTPGFVMSLTACYERHAGRKRRPTRQQLADELAGNLCRCTGYRPILDAGQRMFDLPPKRLPTDQAAAALAALPRGAFEYAAPSDVVPGRRDRFFAPRTLAQLARLRVAHPQARLLAGATDIGLWVNKQFRDLGDIVYVGEVAELKRIAVRDGVLSIGAAASLEDAWAALAQRAPMLTEAWLRFASPPIRHAGTMGGNVANGSPIGDSAPVLIALDAQLLLRRGEHTRRLPLAEFYVDYMVNRLEPGEFVQAVEVPLSAFDATLRAYKISKRFDSDISAVFAVLRLQLDGDVVRDARVVFGGMAAIVKRAAATERAIVGQRWDEAAVERACAALASDFKPLTDLRASAAYRLAVAGGLLRRYWLETRPQAALPPQAVNVWAREPMGVSR
ncbi:MAG: xanthine dehydrogenase small subunit [Ideonella sp.]|nr:xanthine dehydrogenase small subunit [Ideonella sp.]MCC7455712.1 xanthine dehydrogenase small subunit [Nitrospira sp.]